MHSEYRRDVPGAEGAVLFIHGILGTPRHFDVFVEQVPKNVSVRNIRLDGHGKGVREFSRTSMAKWEEQVHRTVTELGQSHRKIYVVAHSLGCLLSVGEALRSEKIVGLFFLAAPLKLSLKPRMVTNSLKVYFDRVRPDDGPGMAAKQCCGIAHSPNFLLYLGWIPRFLELFRKIRETRKLLPGLTVPCTAFQSGRDEMVCRKSCEILRENPRIRVVELPDSMHFYYRKPDFDLVLENFAAFLADDSPAETGENR